MPSSVLLLFMIIIVLFSLYGFSNTEFFHRYLFSVSAIQGHKEYDRLLSSIFLHVGLLHLAFNLYTLYIFGEYIEEQIGYFFFSFLFLSSGVGGNLITLFLKRNESHYTAVGASGAVSGVIFSAIFLFPGIEIGIFPLPFMMPSWVFGILYVFLSVYASAKEAGNIGHEAHLGGAFVGMLVTFAFYPRLFLENILLGFILLVPILGLLLASYKDPLLLQRFINRNK